MGNTVLGLDKVLLLGVLGPSGLVSTPGKSLGAIAECAVANLTCPAARLMVLLRRAMVKAPTKGRRKGSVNFLVVLECAFSEFSDGV